MGARLELVKIFLGGLSIFALMGVSLFYFFMGNTIFVLGVLLGFGLFYMLNKYVKKLDSEGVFY